MIAQESEWIIGARAFIRRTGMSYRQLDHWVREGVLVPLTYGEGSGSRREFDEREVDIGRVLHRVSQMGADGLSVSRSVPTRLLRQVAAVIRDDPAVRWVRLRPVEPVAEPVCDGSIYLSVVAE